MESRALNRPCHHPMPSCCAQHLSSPHTVQGPMGHAARRPTCDSAWPQPLWPPVVKVRNHSLRYRNGRRHHGGYLLALSVRITAISASDLAGCGPRVSWCGCMHRPAAMPRDAAAPPSALRNKSLGPSLNSKHSANPGVCGYVWAVSGSCVAHHRSLGMCTTAGLVHVWCSCGTTEPAPTCRIWALTFVPYSTPIRL